MKNLYVFIGKSGSGKTSIIERLSKYGFSTVESYTTRPPRYEGETGHKFINNLDFDELTDICAYTEFDGYRYATTAADIDNKDIHVLDVIGILSLKKNYTGFKNIKVIALDCSNETLIKRMKGRGDSDEKIKSRVENDKIMFNGMHELADVVFDTEKFSLEHLECLILNWIENTENNTPEPKNKFILLTDLDDVLENLIECWVSLLNFMQRNNPNYIPRKPEEITDWDICSFFPMLTIDEVFEPLNTDLIWKMIKPMPGAVKTLKKYNDMSDVEVRIATSSHYTSIHAKREFLRKNFPYINWDQVIVIKDKQFLNGDVLIDDNPDNIIGGIYKGILFTAYHNKDFQCNNKNIFRANNWDVVDNILEKMVSDFRKKVGENNENQRN